jgi:hypothetical protein
MPGAGFNQQIAELNGLGVLLRGLESEITGAATRAVDQSRAEKPITHIESSAPITVGLDRGGVKSSFGDRA